VWKTTELFCSVTVKMHSLDQARLLTYEMVFLKFPTETESLAKTLIANRLYVSIREPD